MKKTIFLLGGAILLMFALNSCKPDGQDPDTTLTFSTLTVEQQKKNIEQSGLDLADKITIMQQTNGYVALKQFTNNSASLSPTLIESFRQLQNGLSKNDIKALENFNNQMRIASNLGSDFWGTWTWNPSTKNFDKATGVVQNKVVLSFPASDLKSSVNNAVLTILYTESNVLLPHTSPAEFYPKTISAVLKIDNAEAINAQFTGSYATDGTPTSVLQTLVIGAFNWAVSATNTSTDVSSSYAFKYNSDILLKYEVNAKGNFTVTQIDAINNDQTNTKGPEDFVLSGNVTFQIMNVAIYGGITDTKGFMKEGNALKPDSIVHNDQSYKWTEYLYDGKKYNDSEVTIYNKYLKFYGFFAAEKTKFADVEFFTNEGQGQDYSKPATLVYTITTTNYYPPTISVKYDYYDYSYSYNSTTGNYDYTFKFYAYPTKTVYSAQPRLVMSDGSKITDFNTYANDNFQTVITKFQSMFN